MHESEDKERKYVLENNQNALAALNAALCAYMVFSHMRGGGDFATASQGQYLSAGSGLRLAATLGYCALLALAIPAVGARW